MVADGRWLMADGQLTMAGGQPSMVEICMRSNDVEKKLIYI